MRKFLGFEESERYFENASKAVKIFFFSTSLATIIKSRVANDAPNGAGGWVAKLLTLEISTVLYSQ
jgi:hypothetical protein